MNFWQQLSQKICFIVTAIDRLIDNAHLRFVATWLNILAQNKPVNFDLVTNYHVDGQTLILEMNDGRKISFNYATSAAAVESETALTLALLNPSTAAPTISSFNGSPVTNGGGEQICSVIGTNFQSTAQISFGAVDEITVFISQTLLYVFYTDGSQSAGTYDVNYSDALGGTATLPGAVDVV